MKSLNQEPLDHETALMLLEHFIHREESERQQVARLRRPPSCGPRPADVAPFPDLLMPFEDGSDVNMRWREYLAGATYALRMVRAVSPLILSQRRVS